MYKILNDLSLKDMITFEKFIYHFLSKVKFYQSIDTSEPYFKIENIKDHSVLFFKMNKASRRRVDMIWNSSKNINDLEKFTFAPCNDKQIKLVIFKFCYLRPNVLVLNFLGLLKFSTTLYFDLSEQKTSMTIPLVYDVSRYDKAYIFIPPAQNIVISTKKETPLTMFIHRYTNISEVTFEATVFTNNLEAILPLINNVKYKKAISDHMKNPQPFVLND